MSIAAISSVSDATASRFSDDEAAAFHEQGFIVMRGLGAGELCDRMRSVTREHVSREIGPVEYEADLNYPGAPSSLNAPGGHTVRRLKQAHARDIVFTEWVQSPVVTGRLQQLFGQRVVMPLAHHNCVMTKQPHHSSDTGWHQDIRYWSYSRPELISVWLALGTENSENGGLWVIPGSHRQNLQANQFDADLFFREDEPSNQPLLSQAVPVHLESGDVLFFHARTLHSASRNHTQATKFSVVFTFRPADNPPRPGSRSAESAELLLPLVGPTAG